MRGMLWAAVVVALGACEEGGGSKSSAGASAAGSAADARCVAVRSEYIRRRSQLDLAASLGGDPAFSVLAERELAELVNHNWSCFR